MSRIVYLENDDFDEGGILKTKNGIVLIFASWCPHCKKVEPIFEELARENQGYPFYYIQKDLKLPDSLVAQHSALFARMNQITQGNFEGYPAIIKFKNGVLSVFKKPRSKENIMAFMRE